MVPEELVHFLPISFPFGAISVLTVSSTCNSLPTSVGDSIMAVATQPIRSGLFGRPVSRPFEAPPEPDRSSDTMVDQSNVDTVFADSGWSNTTLDRLNDVEDFLDCLEAQGFAEREFEARGNCKFNVRWR